jgi:hypothetical protein
MGASAKLKVPDRALSNAIFFSDDRFVRAHSDFFDGVLGAQNQIPGRRVAEEDSSVACREIDGEPAIGAGLNDFFALATGTHDEAHRDL